MKAFLLALKSFAVSIGGLIVVIAAVFWYADILGTIQNFPPFTVATFGSYLAVLLLMFAVIWAQVKANALLSHGILFFLFASALSGFVTALFSNTPSNAFDGNMLINLLIMLYTLGVVVAYLLYDKPKTSKVTALVTLPMLLFFGVYYIVFGFTSTLLVFLIVLVSLLLGSKVVALAYAMYAIIGHVFLRLYIIMELFRNNGNQSVNNWFIMVLFTVALVFLGMDFVKSIKSNEA